MGVDFQPSEHSISFVVRRPLVSKLLVGLVIVIMLVVASRLLLINEWLQSFNQWVGSLGVFGVVIFIGTYMLAPVVLLPGSVLTVGAGFISSGLKFLP